MWTQSTRNQISSACIRHQFASTKHFMGHPVALMELFLRHILKAGCWDIHARLRSAGQEINLLPRNNWYPHGAFIEASIYPCGAFSKTPMYRHGAISELSIYFQRSFSEASIYPPHAVIEDCLKHHDGVHVHELRRDVSHHLAPPPHLASPNQNGSVVAKQASEVHSGGGTLGGNLCQKYTLNH